MAKKKDIVRKKQEIVPFCVFGFIEIVFPKEYSLQYLFSDVNLFFYSVNYFKNNMNGDECRTSEALLLSRANYSPERAV